MIAIPDIFSAEGDQASMDWRLDFLRTYLERDIPALGPRVPAATLRRFLTMLAHVQGGLLRIATLAEGLGVSGQTVGRYLDLLVDLMLVRRLHPWHDNVGKRLVKSPKSMSGTVASFMHFSALGRSKGSSDIPWSEGVGKVFV